MQLACIVEPDLVFWRHGDPSRLRQVLLNLLGNAVKFTQTGEIVVRIEGGADADMLRISVSDTGIGIHPKSVPHVFEPFLQADEGAARRFGGSGLGLAIVHQLVEAMGGRVDLRSVPGLGSRFDVALALPRALQVVPEPPALGLKVAYFEPHDASAEALHKLLLRMGCEAWRCTDASALRVWWMQARAASGQPWLLACTDVPQTQALLGQLSDWLEPQRVIGMSRVESYAAELARERYQLPRNVIKPVSRSALASRFFGWARPGCRGDPVGARTDERRAVGRSDACAGGGGRPPEPDHRV